MTLYDYPKSLIAPLRAIWQESRKREVELSDLPDDAFLAIVLETAYHASFTSDEQRRTRLPMVICEPHAAPEALRFSSLRQFTPHELMRLGPVAADREVAIGITPASHGPEPRIWGLCSGASMHLTVTIAGPGVLELGRNGVPLIALRGGQIDGGSSGGAFTAIAEYLAEATTALFQGVTIARGSWSPRQVVYPLYLLQVAGNIARAGHGGAILVVPDEDAALFLEHNWVRIKYPTDDASLWPKLTAAIRRFDEATIADPSLRRAADTAEAQVQSALSRLSRLAAVDGAVLITDRFRVLGFGAELTVQASVTHVERADGKSVAIEDFGTRHRSAFRFCSFYPAGLALVCSQDGGTKCIRASGGTVRISE